MALGVEAVDLNVIPHSLQPEELGVDFSVPLGLMVGENQTEVSIILVIKTFNMLIMGELY